MSTSSATRDRPATIPSRMETRAGPCDSPAVVKRSMCHVKERRRLKKESPPDFRRALFQPDTAVKLRAGRGEGIRQLRDDYTARGGADEHQLSGCQAVGCLDRTNDWIANRDRRNALVAMRVEYLDQRLGRSRKDQSGVQRERVRTSIERMEVQSRVAHRR